MQFRKLNKDDIDLRVKTIKQNGLQLLCYKNARVDMNILDETVGPENWQRNHEVVNGNLYCNVGIKVDGEWVWKQDVGVESKTESQKGEASDSFKRACFNWGIGRELYTSPFIWIKSELCDIKKGASGAYSCNDNFEVSDIEITDGVITKLIVSKVPKWGNSQGEVVYTYISSSKAEKAKEMAKMPLKSAYNKLTSDQVDYLTDLIADAQQDEEKLLQNCKVKKWEDLPSAKYVELCGWLKGRM